MLVGLTSLHASYEHFGVQPLGTCRMLVDQQQQRRATAAVAPLSEEKERREEKDAASLWCTSLIWFNPHHPKSMHGCGPQMHMYMNMHIYIYIHTYTCKHKYKYIYISYRYMCVSLTNTWGLEYWGRVHHYQLHSWDGNGERERERYHYHVFLNNFKIF